MGSLSRPAANPAFGTDAAVAPASARNQQGEGECAGMTRPVEGAADGFAGTHLLLDVVAGEGLDDPDRVERALRDCVAVCGATLLHIHTHAFRPQGVSGVAVLAESHISVHTWPEVGYGAFDVFMCGAANPWLAPDVLSRAFAAREVRVREIRRGEGLMGRAGRPDPPELSAPRASRGG